MGQEFMNARSSGVAEWAEPLVARMVIPTTRICSQGNAHRHGGARPISLPISNLNERPNIPGKRQPSSSHLETCLHGSIRRASADGRKWNERPSLRQEFRSSGVAEWAENFCSRFSTGWAKKGWVLPSSVLRPWSWWYERNSPLLFLPLSVASWQSAPIHNRGRGRRRLQRRGGLANR
jgi:hypothetical protein